jgi:hypothetical protein
MKSHSLSLKTFLVGALALGISSLSLNALSLANEPVVKPSVKAAYRADADLVGYVNLRDLRTSPLGQEYTSHPVHNKWRRLKDNINLEPSDIQEIAFSISNLDAIRDKNDTSGAILSLAVNIAKPITLEQIETELTRKKNKDVQVERVTVDGISTLQVRHNSHTLSVSPLIRDKQTLLAIGSPQAVVDIINNKTEGALPEFAIAATSAMDQGAQGFVSLQLTDQLKAKLQKSVDRFEEKQAAGVPIPLELVKNLAQLDVMTTWFTVSDVVQITLAGNYGNETTATQVSQSMEGLLPWLQIMANSQRNPRWRKPRSEAATDDTLAKRPRPRPFITSLSQDHKGDTTYLNITLIKEKAAQ